MAKYRVPIDVKKEKHYFLGYTYYTYKLYSDDEEVEFTSLKFIDIDGFMVGFHDPKDFKSVYVKLAKQAKVNTIKAVEETKNATIRAAEGTKNAVVQASQDVKKIAIDTAAKGGTFFYKIKSKLKKKNDQN